MLEQLRERRGGAENAEVFLMRERLVDIGDDFWIETTGGRRAYKVNGKAVRVRDTLDLETVDGATVAQIQERKLRIRDSGSRKGHVLAGQQACEGSVWVAGVVS
ncbi:MAG TPA: hypothetical protein VES95_02305 [Dermatophilaceae bacterium]|nr:hypothetical protein [Dermatophilaceae bacterium]